MRPVSRRNVKNALSLLATLFRIWPINSGVRKSVFSLTKWPWWIHSLGNFADFNIVWTLLLYSREVHFWLLQLRMFVLSMRWWNGNLGTKGQDTLTTPYTQVRFYSKTHYYFSCHQKCKMTTIISIGLEKPFSLFTI